MLLRNMSTQKISTSRALGTLTMVAVLVAGFVALTTAIGNAEAWSGFLFLTYWSMADQMQLENLPRSFIGALTGLLAASLLVYLPGVMGPAPGLVTAMVVILILIYCSIVGWLPMAVNMATMIFLTVAAGPRILGGGDFLPLFVSLGLGLVYFGGIGAAMAAVGKRMAARNASG